MSVDITVTDHIATIVLNRPHAMNSYDREMREQAYVAWRRLRDDGEIHVAIITGAGTKAFCTGSDLKNSMPPVESYAQQMLCSGDPGGIVHEFWGDKPVICAINGYAVGGGLELALASDIRIASTNAKMGLTEVKVASIPGSGGVQRLPRTVSASDAMLMLLTGDLVDAEEALRMGIVSKVVSPEQLMPTALSIAQRIAANGPLAVRAIKRLVQQGQDMPLARALDVDRYMFGLLRDTEDRIEGRTAFKQKRKPVYRGR